MTGLTARRIAYFAWSGSLLDPEETICGMDQTKYADMMQRIIDEEGPKWLFEAVTE